MQEKFYNDLILKGFCKITIDGYKQAVKKFLKDIKTNTPTKEQAEQWLLEIIKRNCSYSHISNNITIIKNFMKFLGISIDIQHPRRPTELPTKEILTEGEIARILAETKNSREKAILAILVYCGIRNKELCNLKVKDIDFENNIIKVLGGKFNKDRIVPLSKESFRIILDYLKDYKRDENDYLFTTIVENKQYNGNASRDLVKKIAIRAKIKKRVHPHLFRHSLITHLIERGANIVAVQSLAGHSNIETTMLYTHFSPKKIIQEYQYFVPSYI
jgi:integrase/recombinase XerD